MERLIRDIVSPDRGGVDAASVRYLGHTRSGADDRSITVHPGTGHWIALNEGDLLRFSKIGVGGDLYLGQLEANGGASNLALADTPAKPAALGHVDFDSRLIDARLAARGLTQGSVDWRHIPRTSEYDEIVLRAEHQQVLLAAVPDTPDRVLTGAEPGAVEIKIEATGTAHVPLPEPLGLVREEFLIPRGTGTAYEVKEGEYIQVIDVAGRQCSDFMALNAVELDAGHERSIDSTVSRTITGGAFPMPGLFDKFYDQAMQPLLAVVQDTVGRHDTFALACTARGYEERGFPGHVNCSDNISAALDPYGVAKRDAWPAINFFFNSWILPTNNRLQSDEAWSRAGDYVVMQALTDLVCASTACPDDIDPINGWNPTDVHVRIYKKDAPIQRAVAYRPFPDSEARMTNPSPFHERTSQLTNRFHAARDYWMPQSYDQSGAIEEYWACRNGVTVQDMSAMRKFDICGPDAEVLLQACLTRNVSKIALNRGAYALMCDPQGHVVDDGTLFHIAPNVYRWCASSDESSEILEAYAKEAGLRVWVRDMTKALANIAIQGPKSREVLARLMFTQPSHPAIENIKWFGQTVGRVNDRNGAPFMLTRTGFTGELGYELFCDPRDAVTIWDAIINAGKADDIIPMGAEALEIMRIEAGLAMAGAEFTGAEDPDIAGMGFAVDLKKDDFTGKAAIERNRLAPREQLVGLSLEGNDIPHHGDTIFDGRRQIGVVTSATRSPELGAVIALARIAVEHAETGSQVEIGQLDGQIKRLPATVVDFPFIDPTREKPRS